MATPTQPAAETAVKPPDERFWVRYSQHHELPISSLASVAWHTFGLVIIVLIAFVVSFSRTDDMPIENVSFPGGGGNPLGVGPGPGVGSSGGLVEAAKPRELPKDARTGEKADPNQPLEVSPTDLFVGITDDPEAQRQIAKIAERGTDALDRLNKLDKGLRDALGKGLGGPGSGGGKGSGVGTGVGEGEGLGGKINARTKRRLRWTMMFSTSSGQDYVRQLQTLGATLAVNTPPEGEVKIIRNLFARPVKLESEDLGKLMRERIYWVDDDRESVTKLSRVLGLDFVPERVGAFFPKELENQLLLKELAYQNKREEQIRETRFQIMMKGGGKYEILVVDQRLF